MTKEPIMIDDVDVSGCGYLNKEHLTSTKETECYKYGTCNNQTCEYKNGMRYQNVLEQLKRKEQECEELKKSVRSNKDKRKKATERYLRLKEFTNKEFQELKEENKKLKELINTRIEDLCDSCGASSMMPMPCKVYEQALQEIKQIAENAYCLTNGTNKDMAQFAKQILQKCEVINEV